ncbi:MAG: hypothetical protein ACTTH8_05685 [Treponema sp.]
MPKLALQQGTRMCLAGDAWEDEKKTEKSGSFMLLRKPEHGGDLW